MKEKLKYVSNNIKANRVRNGYTQLQTAELLGVTRETYCDYEINPGKLNIEKLTKIANAFNCDIADFFVENKDTQSDN